MITKKKSRWLGIVLGVMAVPLVVLGGGIAASAETEDKNRPGLMPYRGGDFLPDPSATMMSQEPGQMPRSTEDGLWDLVMGGEAPEANTFEWDKESATLLIYSAASQSEWAPFLAEHLSAQTVTVVPTQYSKAQIDDALRAMGDRGGLLPSGNRIVSAVPAKDGSNITVGIQPAPGRTLNASVSIASELNVGVPLVVELAPELEPATRNISYYTNFFSGAYMQSADANRSCTTGFRIGRFSDNGAGMLSAEHCGRDHIGSYWYYSSVSSSDSLIGGFQGMMTVSALAPTDTGLWFGGNASKMYPAVFTGNSTDGGALENIRGGNIPVVGNWVCYTGSRSGNVCENEVTATGTLVCYAATQCYYGTTWTTQRNGIPAAGNGDSGGPVVRHVDGRIYAAGIISGIAYGSTDCTGDPGTTTRKCSPTALFAPLNVALGDGTGWGLVYVP